MNNDSNLIKASAISLSDYGPLLTVITRNPTILQDFGKDELLAKRVIYYILYMVYKRKIDKLIEMDITDFSHLMGIPKNHLQEKVGEPYHFDGLSEKEIHNLIVAERAFDTRFANVIYKLSRIQITGLTKTQTLNSQNELITTVTDKIAHLITDIQLVIYPSKRKKKIIRITPSRLLLQHYSQSFTLVHHDTYIMMLRSRKKNIEDLYAFLVATKNYMLHIKSNTYPLRFDQLCHVSKITHYTKPAKKKQTLKSLLSTIIENAPDLNMHIHWQPSGNYDYKPVMTINNPAQLTKQDTRTLRLNIFYGLTEYFFKETFITTHAKTFPEDQLLTQYPTWLANTSLHRELKIEAYKTAWETSFSRAFQAYHLPYAIHFIDTSKHKNEILHLADKTADSAPPQLFEAHSAK